jgi:hypothetical protein
MQLLITLLLAGKLFFAKGTIAVYAVIAVPFFDVNHVPHHICHGNFRVLEEEAKIGSSFLVMSDCRRCSISVG